MVEQKKIRFKDLSGWVKLSIIAGWISIGYYILAFITGVILGLVELV